MNITDGEVADDRNIRVIMDAPPGKLHNVFPTPKQQTNINDFIDTPRHDTKLKSSVRTPNHSLRNQPQQWKL